MKKENAPVSQEKFKTLIGGQALIRIVEYLLISELAFFGAFWLGKKFEEYMK